MKTKKFLIQVISDDQTRWQQDDAFVARQLKFIATAVTNSVTLGSIPQVECDLYEPQGDLFGDTQPLPPR